MSQILSEVAEKLFDHLRNDTTDLAESDFLVPIDHFRSQERANAEIALMQRLPLIVAHRSEIPEVGDFITREVLGKQLLIVRQSDGKPATYLNMCRHRGGRVELQEKGSRRLFMCHYHGWSYDRDGGALKSVPFADSFDSFDRSCNGLKTYLTEERHGFVFVNFSNDASRTLADWLGPEVDSIMAPWNLENAVTVREGRFPLDINWKLVVDGAIDIMHPQFLHPDGVGKLIVTNIGVFRQYGRHGQHFGARLKLQERLKAGEKVEGTERYISYNLMLYPNSMMIAAPDHVEFWTLWPTPGNPAHCTVHLRFLARPEILTDKMRERIHMSWDILQNAAGNEDWPMELSIQKNVMAGESGHFRYGRSELSCAHLHRQLHEDLGN